LLDAKTFRVGRPAAIQAAPGPALLLTSSSSHNWSSRTDRGPARLALLPEPAARPRQARRAASRWRVPQGARRRRRDGRGRLRL